MVINELVAVLFWQNMDECVRFYKKLMKDYLPDNEDEYYRQSDAFKFDYIKTKENFINIINEYGTIEKPLFQSQAAQYCAMVVRADMRDSIKNGSSEIGKRRHDQYEKAINSWAYHLSDYANAVNNVDDLNVLELATGAGLGTCAIMKTLQPNSRMISIDIDFSAAKNADGLAQFLNLSDRVSGMNANFWHLPFEESSFDIVCTHYGLDEAGEIEAVVKEASRVLKPDGRFVIIARKNPYDRHKRNMRLFNITESECNPLLKKARLYSGFDDLVETAIKHNLIIMEHKLYDRDIGHHRILFAFRKN